MALKLGKQKIERRPKTAVTRCTWCGHEATVERFLVEEAVEGQTAVWARLLRCPACGRLLQYIGVETAVLKQGRNRLARAKLLHQKKMQTAVARKDEALVEKLTTAYAKVRQAYQALYDQEQGRWAAVKQHYLEIAP